VENNNSQKTKCKVFISYAQSDGFQYANNLKTVLDGLGYPSFVSKENMRQYFGDTDDISADQRILGTLEGCGFFVLLATKNALESSYVKKEIALAVGKDKIILPYYSKPDLNSEAVKAAFPSIKEKQFEAFYNKEELAQNVLARILDIEHKSLKSFGILKIFKNRQSQEYVDAVTESIKDLSEDTVQMLGISLRDWFGEEDGKHQARFAPVLEQALKNRVQFKVLLIDPTSDIAKERAIVESGSSYKNDRKYVSSPLFQDIKRVSTWITNREKMRQNNKQLNIEAHYYDFMLSLYAIITPTVTFLEQYHIGDIGRDRAPGDENAICLGGYVPVLMLDSKSKFGRNICDHFNKIWAHQLVEEGERGNTFENVNFNMKLLERDPLRFRLQQFAVKTHRRCDKIVDSMKTDKDSIKSNF
jgi:hypothetical protein